MTEDELVNKVALAIRYAYGEDVYRTQARAAVTVVLEEAIRVCEDLETELWKKWKGHYNMLDQGRSDGAGDCAEALKAMIPKREGN